MKVIKAGSLKESRNAEQELEAINAFAKAELGAEQVYVFSVLLCDNEVDRDFERFSDDCLKQLGELFEGVSGISDHEWKCANQLARIYRTEFVRDTEHKNSLGEPYAYLLGHAYMLRTESTAELIAQIEGGIRRETSVGCSVAKSVCSICGEDIASCKHIRGESYGGRLCYASLEDAVDAYEWSFVAVPAQRNAGVMKKYKDLESFALSAEGKMLKPELEALRKSASLGEKYLSTLRSEVLRLCLVCDKQLHAAIKGSVSVMDEPELLSMKAAFEKRAGEMFPPKTQLPGRGEVTAFCGDEYLI